MKGKFGKFGNLPVHYIAAQLRRKKARHEKLMESLEELGTHQGVRAVLFKEVAWIEIMLEKVLYSGFSSIEYDEEASEAVAAALDVFNRYIMSSGERGHADPRTFQLGVESWKKLGDAVAVCAERNASIRVDKEKFPAFLETPSTIVKELEEAIVDC